MCTLLQIYESDVCYHYNYYCVEKQQIIVLCDYASYLFVPANQVTTCKYDKNKKYRFCIPRKTLCLMLKSNLLRQRYVS